MKIYSNKNVQIAVFFILINLLTVTWAEDMKSPYATSEPRTLHMLPVAERYCHYDVAEVFVDANDNIFVLCSFGFQNNDKHNEKALLFVFHNNKWLKSSITQSGFPLWRGMLDNGQFQAYSVYIPQAEEPSTVQTISIYGLTSDMKLSFSPKKIIKMDKNKKAFKQESYRIVEELLPLENYPDKFFIVGYYRESRFNPIDLIRLVMSGGHWGFVVRPFGALVERDKIKGYYNTPEKLKTNENSGKRYSIVSGNKIHRIGIKYREYHSDPEVVQYAYFDLSSNKWSNPVELFKGRKAKRNVVNYFSVPSVVCYKDNVYCSWDWTVSSRTSDSEYLRPVSTGETGVYFCSSVDNQWANPVKIADLGENPKVAVDNDGNVHVVWLKQHEGLFHKVMSHGYWSDTNLVFEDSKVGDPLSLAIDQNNNLNIVYARTSVRENKSKGRKFEPEELVYLKFTKAPQ